MVKRVEKIAQSVGVRINYGRMIGPDTRDAHRLVYLSREDPAISSEIHGELVERLLEAFHERAMDITRPEVLRRRRLRRGLRLRWWRGGWPRMLAMLSMRRQGSIERLKGLRGFRGFGSKASMSGMERICKSVWRSWAR